MDSITEITKTVQHQLKNTQTSSSHLPKGVERRNCIHGTPCMVNADGSLCLWECSKCAEIEDEQKRIKDTEQKRYVVFSETLYKHYHDFRSIPKRFKDKTIQTFIARTKAQKQLQSICKSYVQNFDNAKESGTCMVFCGKPGTGKTHLAYAIVNALHKKYVTAGLISAQDMTAFVKSAYRNKDNDETPSDIVRQFASLDLLVIDEVGVQVDSDSEKRIFFDVMNKRYEEMRPTILISNLSKDELTKYIGERVMDRLRENKGIVFAFDWESHRR